MLAKVAYCTIAVLFIVGVFFGLLTEERTMWIIIFIVALLFVLGSALLLLRSANMMQLPDNIKARPYEEEED